MLEDRIKKPKSRSGEGRNPCFVLAMDSGLRRNDDVAFLGNAEV
jgi:hypothetical protein